MGDIVILVPRPKRLPKVTCDDNLADIVGEAVEIAKQTFGRQEGSIFRMYGSFENLLRAKIGTTLMADRSSNVELFRCSLYVSEMLGHSLASGFESYHTFDYFVRGYEEGEPDHFKKGGDLCFVLCTFFEGRCNRPRRPLKLSDYLDLGARLYSTYHAETRSEIGYCMGGNFQAIVDLTKRSLRTL